MRFKATILALPLLLLPVLFPASAQLPQATSAGELPLRDCQAAEKRDLGVWDDIFVLADQDFIVLRQDEKLFSMSMTSPSSLKKLVTVPAARKTQIVAGIHSDDKLWLFLQSSETVPFAIDAYGGEVAKFDIPGLKIPGERAAYIQSHVIIPQAYGAILMVSGGDRETWPRTGNNPVYFWISLKTGKVVRFPIGWDLEYFSSNQTIAVFEAPQEIRFQRRSLQAVDIRTGRTIDEIPDRRKEGGVPFNWTETQDTKAFYVRREETGDADYFAGISVNGLVVPLNAELDKVHYLSTAKTKDNFVGFRLRREGFLIGEPCPFLLAPLKGHQTLERAGDDVTDFAMLRDGNCILVTAGQGPKGVSSEAFIYNHNDKSRQNILDGVERLPELDKEFTDKPYIEDKMTIRLHEGFGNDENGFLVLCLFDHFRGDMRALRQERNHLESETWRRAIVVTSDGERYLTDLFREENVPDKIWLHNYGKVIMGNNTWQEVGSTRERKVNLSEVKLRLPQ